MKIKKYNFKIKLGFIGYEENNSEVKTEGKTEAYSRDVYVQEVNT